MQDTLSALGIKQINEGCSSGLNWFSSGESISSFSPVDGKLISKVKTANSEDYQKIISTSKSAFEIWKTIPAPKRGEFVRQFGDKLRIKKNELGKLVSYEMGKSYQEGLGEVQEMIDICDLAVGMSRQLFGLQMHSERPKHRMMEQWHPLGVVGIISAFNFPVAVWAWNATLAWICGNVCIWKPSEKTPLCSIACQNIWNEVALENNLPEGISSLINGDYKIGEYMTADHNVSLISATGSTRMGKIVGSKNKEDVLVFQVKPGKYDFSWNVRSTDPIDKNATPQVMSIILKRGEIVVLQGDYSLGGAAMFGLIGGMVSPPKTWLLRAERNEIQGKTVVLPQTCEPNVCIK